MVVVPPGSFLMGSADSEAGRWANEGPQRRVTLDYRFAAGVYEVTFEDWDACVRGGRCDGYEPDDEGWGRGRRPVINVGWEEAWRYADWLTEQTGEEYRLLSEAEWEYAARAGTETARYWGESQREQRQHANGYDAVGYAEYTSSLKDDPIGCRDRCGYTAPVGSYRPNAFGLYNVLGNVEEWRARGVDRPPDRTRFRPRGAPQWQIPQLVQPLHHLSVHVLPVRLPELRGGPPVPVLRVRFGDRLSAAPPSARTSRRTSPGSGCGSTMSSAPVRPPATPPSDRVPPALPRRAPPSPSRSAAPAQEIF